MIHDLNIVGRPSDKKALSVCLQALYCKERKRPRKNLRCGEKERPREPESEGAETSKRPSLSETGRESSLTLLLGVKARTRP